jgi:hypothetical protein
MKRFTSVACDNAPISPELFARLALENGLFVKDQEGVLRGPVPWSTKMVEYIAVYFHSRGATTRIS